MKLTTIRAFEKHLQDAAPNYFSPVYMFLCKEDFERKELEEMLVKALGGDVRPFNGAQARIDAIVGELNSFDFFAGRRAVVVRQADALDKKATEALESYFLKPNPSVFLILSAETINRATRFYKNSEAAGVLVDIEEEKPWQKEEALALKATRWVEGLGKTMEASTARYFLKYTGGDQALMQQELQKLASYTGDRNTVTEADIRAICVGAESETLWQLGDALFRNDGAAALRIGQAQIVDGEASFFAWVRQLRSQFQTKLLICSILEEGGGPNEVQMMFPYMRGKILDQHLQQAKAYGMMRLRQGLLAIDAMELLAKNSSLSPETLVQHLLFKLLVSER